VCIKATSFNLIKDTYEGGLTIAQHIEVSSFRGSISDDLIRTVLLVVVLRREPASVFRSPELFPWVLLVLTVVLT